MLSPDRDYRAGWLTAVLFGQVIAPLLVIRRVANKSALTSDITTPGVISSFKARNGEELTAGSVGLPGRNPNCCVAERDTNPCELGVDTTIYLHRDSSKV